MSSWIILDRLLDGVFFFLVFKGCQWLWDQLLYSVCPYASQEDEDDGWIV